MCDCFCSSPISPSLPKFTNPQFLTLTLSPKFPPQTRFPFFRFRQTEPRKNWSSCSTASENRDFRAELGFKEDDEDVSSDFLESKDDDELVRLVDDNGAKEEGLVSKDDDERIETRKWKQVLKRSCLLAKQVISIRTALSLGFVSQLWVDTSSWVVLFIEVRSNLLSGECDRFLLDDVSQVGDVVLVEDETVINNEFKMVGLETLVGYKVVTPRRRDIGKVRGYTFNINSGAIESLELDSFGISIIPSSLVSTYALLVEDVLEVLSDAVVVHEAAASRIQRLTKGFLDSQGVGTNIDDVEEYSDFERPQRPERSTNSRRSSRAQRPRKTSMDIGDDWELPMDYLSLIVRLIFPPPPSCTTTHSGTTTGGSPPHTSKTIYTGSGSFFGQPCRSDLGPLP